MSSAPTRAESHARRWTSAAGFVTKLLLMGLVNAFGVYLLWSAYVAESWGIFSGALALLVVVNWIYFAKRTLPLKYLAPGLVLLLVMQLFVMVYTGFVAFTNYGTGHNASMDQAVDALLIQSERRTPDSPTYPMAVITREDDDALGLAILDDATVRVGDAENPLQEVPDAVVTDGVITEVPGWQVLPRTEVVSDPGLAEAVTALRVPVSDDVEDGSIRTREGRTAAIHLAALRWDEAAQTLTNVETGAVYHPNEGGNFEAEDGSTLPVGWRVGVGFANFSTAFTDTDYSAPFLRILVWTFAFAILTVVTSFLAGLVLAGLFDDRRIRGRKVWRTLFILPYAFPAFLSALLWRGMLNANPDYGIVNRLVFFGTRIEWLNDPTLAKVTILAVNLWLSFPYWFLVCTGALQSLPADVTEAAKIDGASPMRTWRSISLPLLLISTAPLLIASFAFNFNNFTLIYMLTGGGPRFADTSALLGHTDILISMIYQISGVAGGRADFGLASALSILVFLIVGGISAIAFRRTRKLEEIL
ncbi:ABC transporter permease subunit [Pseudactinotalea sp.]|uniref:ABC transporter permease subunit n=1 Tax=Pseudactinotalea sp. TaxID=1926260 RepID=UPI003B3A4C38